MASGDINPAEVDTLVDTMHHGEIYKKTTKYPVDNGGSTAYESFIYKYCSQLEKNRCIYVSSNGYILKYYGITKPQNPTDVDDERLIVIPTENDQKYVLPITLGNNEDNRATYREKYGHIVADRKGGRRRRTKKSRKSKKTKKVKKSRRRH